MDLFEHADGGMRTEAETLPVPPPAAAPALAAPRIGMPRSPFGAGMAAFRRQAPAPGSPPKPASPGAAAAPAEPAEELQGKVRRVICHAQDSGFTVLAVVLKGGEETTVQAITSQTFREGDPVTATGAWTNYKGKRQFKAANVAVTMPSEARGVADWLLRGAVKGVGPGTVRKLLAALGDDLFKAVGDADALRSAGVKAALAEAIASTWNANAGMAVVEAQLGRFGLKPRQIVKVIERYGAAALKVARTNPWELIDVEGIGFPTADAMARVAGLDMTCAPRMRSGLEWAMNECLAREGHCGMPERQLVSSAARMLDVEEEVVEGAMAAFLGSGYAQRDDLSDLLYPLHLLEAEELAADHLAALLARSLAAVPRAEAEAAVLRAERELGVQLDRDGGQFEAAVMALSNAVCVITGGPGTGKSTTQAVIVKAHSYFGRAEDRVRLFAPTGRAARRLSETSGRQALTVHRTLEFIAQENGFRYREGNPLKLDVGIGDEWSMVDLKLMASTVEALPPDACFTMVGDIDQLPSVGPGQVLRDLIESGVVPVARLTRVHRQAAGSGVAIAAQRINRGEAPEEPGGRMRGFKVVHKEDEELLDEVVRLVRFALPEAGFDPMRDVQVVAAMRKGEVGVTRLNEVLKAALNPATDDDRTVRMPGRVLTVGDRVMQLRNDYEKGVYNGEVGTVTECGYDVEPGQPRRPWAVVDFSGVTARYAPDDCEDIDLAYAATVHKVQGCEAPVVIFVAPRAHRRMLGRNLLYTGVTRARLECIVVGDRTTIDAAPRAADAARRHTGLRARLAEAMDRELGPGMRL